MIIKDFKEISISDFRNLIDNGVGEGRTIEYKKELPLATDSDKKEFLYDTSSFANASGGDLIFGISQDNGTGLPDKMEGIDVQNPDEMILKLESLIRDGIAPRISGIQIKTYSLDNSKNIVLIRVPKSWNSPHQVIFK